MADSSRSKPGTSRVALPKIPPWKAPVPLAETTKSSPQPTTLSDGKARDPVDLTSHIGARYAPNNFSNTMKDFKLISDQRTDYEHSLDDARRHYLLLRLGSSLKYWSF